MFIEIESLHGDKLIEGKQLNINEIEDAIKEILEVTNEENFSSVFCSRFQYKEVAHSNEIHADYTIDLDTHLVVKNQY